MATDLANIRTDKDLVLEAKQRHGDDIQAVALFKWLDDRNHLRPVWHADQGYAASDARYDLSSYRGVATLIVEPFLGENLAIKLADTRTGEELLLEAKQRHGADILALLLQRLDGTRESVWRSDRGYAKSSALYHMSSYRGVATMIVEPILGIKRRTVTARAAAA